jgi:alcohol dehydrogenase class IV
MMREPEVWTLERLLAEDLGPTVVWATPSVAGRVASALTHPLLEPLSALPGTTRTLIAVGGGTLIDAAKIFRVETAPELRLVAIPSVWGSGAEASPVAVMQDGLRKRIRIGEQYVPDIRVVWPELSDSLPERRVRQACGDAWSHALESFLSPLAERPLRRDIAALIGRLRELPLGRDPRWFESSVEACRLQAASSVGLTHGIAHTLEGPLLAGQPDSGWGHAALCATFLWPVMSLNLRLSDRTAAKFEEEGLEPSAVLASARFLFEEDLYDRAVGPLAAHWSEVLRDPCTRTNGVLVRPNALDHFVGKAFAA